MLERVDARLHGLSIPAKRRLTRGLVLAGLCAVGYYYAWWLEAGRALRPALAPFLALAVLYTTVQLFTGWYSYLRIEIPPDLPAPAGLSVDVFVPVYDEDPALVEASLTAAVAIRYPHRTLLLDDSPSEDFRALAARLGAVYVRREGHAGAKAGNVNHALGVSDADFVAIFDVDHIPEPHFLDAVLGHFDGPKIGFVQALVAHRNQKETFVSRASSGQSDDVFGPTSMGWNGCGAALVWGAHCTFRRSALDSIGGYQRGLAEDLHTSLALHAAGWRSVYVPKLVARGLTTADLGAHFTQHLKWSRGVLGAVFEGGARKLTRLRASQAACYLMRMSYYTIGTLALVHMALLSWGLHTGRDLTSYFLHFLPLLTMIIVIRKVVGAMWEQDPNAGWQLTGIALALSTWPIYVFSLVSALLGLPMRHRATPKGARGGNFIWLVLPQIAMCALLVTGLGEAAERGIGPGDLATVIFTIGMLLAQSVLVRAVWEGWSLARAAGRANASREERGALPAFGGPNPQPEPAREI